MLATKNKFEGKVKGNRIIWEGEGEVAWLEPYGKDALRFRSSKSLRIAEGLNWTLLNPEANDQTKIKVFANRATIENGKIRAEVLGDGTVNYFNVQGEALLQESWMDFRSGMPPMRRAREFSTISSDVFEISLYFKANKDEHFYGLGQDPNDCFDLKGSTVELLQKNTKSTIPFVYSSKGYGFLWNNPAIGRVELTNNHTMWQAKAAKQIDYIIMVGATPAGVLEKFTEITGRAPVLPEWAAGFWQCKLRYETQAELLAVAREYKKRGIPLAVIVVDYFHWTQQGEWKFDPKYWPDPKGMVKELDAMGVRLMVSIWPTVDPRSENYAEMTKKNFLIRAEKGLSAFFMFLGPESIYDATHSGARDFVWAKAKKNYYDLGVKMFWLDEAEPEIRPYDYDNLRYYLGNGQEMSNIYPYMYAKTFYDGMKAEGETEIVNLVRCAWLGSQRLGVVLWSGDIASTFESLRKQMKAGLHIAMCGIPWWTTDIGGFLFGHPDDPEFRELIVRWFQFGVFCPIFRLHGFRLPYKEMDINDSLAYCHSGGPNEIWSFGEEAYGIIKEVINVRERLKPYIIEQMELASEKGTPVMRPLFFDFPEDEATYTIGDEFMFGPELLVAPVTLYGARTRVVYLPAGTNWVNAKNGKKYAGGQSITVDAPLELIPLFFKNSAHLPIY
ncbi:MAG: glycoside hydrolase family 31 protein [Clostridia bacterium]